MLVQVTVGPTVRLPARQFRFAGFAVFGLVWGAALDLPAFGLVRYLSMKFCLHLPVPVQFAEEIHQQHGPYNGNGQPDEQADNDVQKRN